MSTDVIVNILFFETILVLFTLPGILIGLRFEGNRPSKRLWFEPAGYLVPLVWILLFGLLAVLQFNLQLINMTEASVIVFMLVFVCALYPYYTLGLERITGISAVKLGLFGNGLILMVSLWLASEVGQQSPSLAYFVLPVSIWTAYTSVVLLGRLRLIRERVA